MKIDTTVKSSSRIALLLILFFTCLHISYGQTDLKNDDDVVLATVNGEPITLFAVLADTAPRERQLALQYGSDFHIEREKVRRAAIDDIINRKLISQKFRAEGHRVPKQIIEKMLDTIAKDLAGGSRKLLEQKARDAGYSVDELKKQAVLRAATMMLINARCYSKVFITPKEVHDFYEEHKNAYKLPQKIKLQALYLKSKGFDSTGNISGFAFRLRPKIIKSNREEFSKLVKAHSMGLNKDGGGMLDWIEIAKLRPEFHKALKDKVAGDVAGPITTKEGFYFLRIDGLEEKKSSSFQNVRVAIKTKLENDEKEKNYKKYIKEIRSTAVIRYLTDDLKK